MRKKYTNTEFGNHHEVFKQVANIDQVQDNIFAKFTRTCQSKKKKITTEEIIQFGIDGKYT